MGAGNPQIRIIDYIVDDRVATTHTVEVNRSPAVDKEIVFHIIVCPENNNSSGGKQDSIVCHIIEVTQ